MLPGTDLRGLFHLNNALLVGNDSACIKEIHTAIESYMAIISMAVDELQFNSVLNQSQVYQLVVMDADSIESLYGYMDSIKNNWPNAEIIILSSDMSLWVEFIQRGAYEVLPKPVNTADLDWAASGALLKHTHTRAMRAAS